MKGRKPPEDKEPGAPLYMLSFADMMTNILCFFILLCAFSKEKMVGFISDGVGSFKVALEANGLPGVLQGDRLPVDLGANRVLFRPSKSVFPRLLVEDDGTIKEENRDGLRDVLVAALKSPQETVLPMPIVFDPGRSALTKAHRSVLKLVSTYLTSGSYDIRIEGYCFQEGVPTEASWELAQARAEEVARYVALAGPVSPKRLQVMGYGPPQSRDEVVIAQKRWGRRVVLITLVTPKG